MSVSGPSEFFICCISSSKTTMFPMLIEDTSKKFYGGCPLLGTLERTNAVLSLPLTTEGEQNEGIVAELREEIKQMVGKMGGMQKELELLRERLYSIRAELGGGWVVVVVVVVVGVGVGVSKFYAVNTLDGSIAWTYDMGCKGEMWGTLGPLSISDSTVCVGAGGNAIPYLNMDAKLVCLDKASGNLVWEAPAGKQIQSRPSLGSELIFVGDYSGHLFGYETSTGKLAFDSKLGDGILEGEPP